MSKLIPSISGLACVFWVAVWTWGLSKEHSDPSSIHLAAPSIRITDADSVFTANEVFSFHLSDDKPVVPAECLIMLQRMAQHLSVRTDKNLTLTGSYLAMPYERNQSQHPNLGIARANAIRDILVGEGADPDRISTAAQEVQDHLMIEGRLLGGVDFDFSEAIAAGETTVANADTATVEKAEKERKTVKTETKAPEKKAIVFDYDFKDFTLAKKYRSELDELRKLVQSNPSFRLNITGYSSKDEEKAVPGLAERRSLAIRRYLVDTGVRRRNIIVESHPGTATDDKQRRVEISIVK